MCTLMCAGNDQMTAQVPSQINLRFLLPSMLWELIARQPNTPVWARYYSLHANKYPSCLKYS
jgi:hypothetical protein